MATKFGKHFPVSRANLTNEGSGKLLKNYIWRRVSYIGSFIPDVERFDAEVADTFINDMKRGKAVGLDGLSSEHVINCHPILPCMLARLFDLIIRLGFAHHHNSV